MPVTVRMIWEVNLIGSEKTESKSRIIVCVHPGEGNVGASVMVGSHCMVQAS